MQPTREHAEYFSVELEQWHGVVLMIARTPDGRLWWPVRTMCAILGIAPGNQRTKLQEDEDFAPLLREDLPMPTVKGERPMLCLDFEGMAGWLASIRSQFVRPEMRANVRRFRRLAWAAASEILLGQREPAPERLALRGATQQERLRELTSVIEQVEDRLGAVEGAVFVPERDDESPAAGERLWTCPNCQVSYHLTPSKD